MIFLLFSAAKHKENTIVADEQNQHCSLSQMFPQNEILGMKNCTVQLEKMDFAHLQPQSKEQQNEMVVEKGNCHDYYTRKF